MRTTRSRLTLVAVGLVLALAATGCSSDDESAEQGESASAPSGSLCGSIPGEGPGSLGAMSEATAAEAIAQAQLLTTLSSASTGAEVEATLEGEGPYTVFAPSNAAFGQIPAGELDSLLADPEQVDELLGSHVVEGDETLAALAESGSVTSSSGERLRIEDGEDGLTINGAKVVCGPIQVANGTIYIVDQVLRAA